MEGEGADWFIVREMGLNDVAERDCHFKRPSIRLDEPGQTLARFADISDQIWAASDDDGNPPPRSDC